ncbi:hypothetical protein [Flavobacterium sp. UBA4197]|uniref:hypothetical protein n=1 Tax=Flavobacterium sp. UBA4197 TaxID=1946546 RepID=UPI00257A735C|nr:hypothetical protein [Flavobacterium sp. UBA4197]HRB72440.1 hypothetical protein [Flavobacterium sp.]
MVVYGNVILVDDNKSVYDADVTVKATGQTTKTDINGNFSISVPNANSMLSISFANITLPKEVKAGDVTGSPVYLQLDPSINGTQINIKPVKDYKMVFVGLTIVGVLATTALILTATNSQDKKEEKIKEVEA